MIPALIQPKIPNKDHKRADTEFPAIHQYSSQKILPVHRLLQVYPSVLNCDRLTTSKSSTGLIGPGYYNISSSSLGGPSFTFSSTSLLPSCFSVAGSPVLRDTIDFPRKNMKMEEFLPHNRQEIIRLKAKSKDHKIKEIIEKKKIISEQAKKAKIKKIKDKHKKFQMKAQHTQIKTIANNWLVLASIFSFAFYATQYLNYKKNLHFRSEKLSKSLSFILKAYGKFKLSLINNRIERAKVTLNILARVIKKKIKILKPKYQKTINEIMDRAATHDIIFKLMYH